MTILFFSNNFSLFLIFCQNNKRLKWLSKSDSIALSNFVKLKLYIFYTNTILVFKNQHLWNQILHFVWNVNRLVKLDWFSQSKSKWLHILRCIPRYLTVKNLYLKRKLRSKRLHRYSIRHILCCNVVFIRISIVVPCIRWFLHLFRSILYLFPSFISQIQSRQVWLYRFEAVYFEFWCLYVWY